MLEFPEEYFYGEVIDGFYVEPLMKRCWAAQLELYLQLKEICDKHHLKVFADYGTLLGAVRHQNYIPWDDDFDVCMMRADFMKLIRIIPQELEDGQELFTIYRQQNHRTKLARFVNSTHLDPNFEHMSKYHGFPFIVGIDIFPIDYIPRDQQKRNIWGSLIEQTWQLERMYSSADADVPRGKKFLDDLAERCNITFEDGDRDFMTWQLRLLLDELCAACDESSADDVGTALYQAPYQFRPNYTVPKETFDSVTTLPFGPIKIDVAQGYLDQVKMRYGEDYMKPNRYIAHEYPYYREQQLYVEDNFHMRF